MPTIRVPLGALKPDSEVPADTAPIRVSLADLTAAPDEASTRPPDFKTTSKPISESLKDFAGEATAGLNPVTINKAIQAAFWHPIETVKGTLAAQDVPRQKAMQAFEQGRHVEGVGHLINWLVPLLGPRMDEAGDLLRKGEYAKGLGATTDVAAQVVLPAVAERAVGAVRGSLPALARSVNTPADAAAVAYGQAHGVPIDAATATGRPSIRNIQKKLEGTLGGSAPARASQLEQQTALSRVGGQLADQVHPTPVQPVQAGEGVRDAITAKIQEHATVADQAYDAIRQREAANPTAFQVNIGAEKTALKPLYDDLMESNKLVPLQGGKGRALVALHKLMTGPDAASLSTVDAALGDLKSMARGADMPELRTAGQGAAAQMVKVIDTKVRAAAQQAGVLPELEAGRAATTAKYATADVADLLTAEPRGIFNQLTMRKDGGLSKLRAVEQVAPEKLPELGRAVLEDMLDEATSTGGFEKGKTLETRWQNLGPATKQKLFGANAPEIDKFFRLAAKLTENANPSGTANVLSALNLTQVAAYVPAKVLSKILFSPQGAKLLTTAVRVSVNPTKASRAFAAAQVLRAAKAAGVPLPAAADREIQP